MLAYTASLVLISFIDLGHRIIPNVVSIPGIILGALALIVLPEAFREFELYRMLALGGAMVVMMQFRPEGIIPAQRMGTRSEEKG